MAKVQLSLDHHRQAFMDTYSNCIIESIPPMAQLVLFGEVRSKIDWQLSSVFYKEELSDT